MLHLIEIHPAAFRSLISNFYNINPQYVLPFEENIKQKLNNEITRNDINALQNIIAQNLERNELSEQLQNIIDSINNILDSFTNHNDEVMPRNDPLNDFIYYKIVDFIMIIFSQEGIEQHDQEIVGENV